MRFRRLDLTRYGKFTDFSLDFGEKPDCTPDLHIIFGPNEAGKSTTFAAMLDLLYGIERKSKYGFKHPYPTMRLDAEIEFQDKIARFTRLKRDQNSLLDAQGAVLADSTILSELGGIDRAAFQTMYSLDDETLEDGGESVLASKGELGELLFSASSGLASLSQSLVELRAESDRFFKPRNHTHDLSQYKKDLEALKLQSDVLDVAASTFAKLIDARGIARERYGLAARELASERKRLLELQAAARAYPKYRSLIETRGELEPLVTLPTAPAGWYEGARALELEAARLETAERHMTSELARSAEELSAIVVDENVLELAHSFSQLDIVRAQHLSAAKDLPARRTRKAETDGAIATLLRRLDQPLGADAAELILKPGVKGELTDLMEERAQLDLKSQAAQIEYERSDSALREAEADLASSGVQTEALSDGARHRLSAVVETVQASDHAVRGRLARKASHEAHELLKTQIHALRPWTGNAAALSAQIVPSPETVAEWQETAQDLAMARQSLSSEIERLETGLSDTEVQLSILGTVGGLITDGEAQKIRRDREAAWQAHQSSLNLASANTFEAAMRQDDEVGNARLMRVSDLARVNELSVQKALTAKQLADRHAKLAGLDQNLDNLKAALATSFAAISPDFPLTWSPQQLAAWLKDRSTALASQETLRRLAIDIEDADIDADALATQLRETLNAAAAKDTSDLGLELLVGMARDLLDADSRLRASASELSRLRRDRDARKSALEAIDAKLVSWSIAWNAACSTCWLGAKGDTPTVTTVRGLFLDLDALSDEVKTRDDLAYRIHAMEADQSTYADQVRALAAKIGLPASLPAPDADLKLSELIAAATAANAARGNAQSRQQTTVQEAARLADERTAFQTRLMTMCTHFQVATLLDVVQALEQLKTRQALQDKVDACEQDILEILQAGSFAEAQEQLKGLDLDAVRLDIEATTLRVESEDGHVKSLYAEKRSAEDAVDNVDGDNAVAKLEEQKRTLLLQIEDGALKWMRLKLGITATEHALRIYREQHRSSLLNQASEAFALVSRNAYTQLRSQPEKDGEILVAIDKNGASKRATDLSKGTRFQLYLALRVAGYHESITQRPSVPFIADDILETFDDFRAEETLKVFAGMANFGQVIYLTHHQHLCDIARQVCPSVKIHLLEGA